MIHWQQDIPSAYLYCRYRSNVSEVLHQQKDFWCFVLFCLFFCAGWFIPFLVLDTLTRESQFAWMSYKYTHTIGLQRKKKKKIRSLKRRGGWEREARRMIAHLFLMFIMHPYVSLLLHTIKILTTLKKTEQLHKTKSDKRTTMILMHHSLGGYGVTEMSCFNKEAGDQAMKSRSQV